MASQVELPALPRATVLIVVGWNLVGQTILVLLLGPWVLLPWAIAVVLTGVGVAFGRRRLAQPFATRAASTGVRVPALPPSPPVAPSGRAWSGAALVPTALGGLNASTPLAELSIGDGGVLVRIRPSLLALTFGYQATPIALEAVEAVVPVVRTVGKGVAIRPRGCPATYFFTGDVPHVLTELERAGFPVDWSEQRVRLWGRAR